MICISNCCEYLFELIEENKIIASADIFLPILIYLILQSNVSHLHSNIKYILEYRHPDKLISESGYFLTNIQGAIMFWQNINFENLNISKEEFFEIKNGNLFNTDDFDLILKDNKKIKQKLFDNENIKIIENLSNSSSSEEESTMNTPILFEIENENELNKKEEEEEVKLRNNENQINSISELNEIEKKNDKVELIDTIEHEMNEKEKEETILDKIEHLVQNLKISNEFQNKEIEDLKVGELKILLQEYKKLLNFKNNVKDLF